MARHPGTPRGLLCGLLLLAGGCSVLQGPITASGSDVEGQAPIPVDIDFQGNTEPTAELRVAARPALINLSRGQPVRAGAADVEFNLENHYRGLGYPNPVIQATVDPPARDDAGRLLPDAEMMVHAEIREGLRVLVTRLDLVGNVPVPQENGEPDFTDEVLTALWSRRNSGTLGLGEPFFVQSDLESFATGIASYYRQRGHLAVEVTGPEITAPSETTREVTIRIDPGPLYRFGQITLSGPLAERLAQPDVGDLRPTPPSGPFTTRDTQEYLISIRATLRILGHPYPRVFLEPLGVPESTTIDLQVKGEPGPGADWGEIRIEGNERTRDSYVQSKLQMEPGDRFDGRALEESVNQLYQTGLFRTARLSTSQVKDDGTVDGRLQLEELPDQSVEFLGGYGSYERLRGGVLLTDRNLFGRALIGTVGGRVSQRGWRATTGLTDRDLFGTPITGNITLETFERQEPSFTDRAVGGTASLSRLLLRHLRTRLSYAYFDRTGAEVEALDPAAALNDYTEGRVTLDLEWDRQDSLLLPRNGYQIRFGVDVQDPALAADIDIVRLRTALTWHREWTSWFRTAMRAEAGWLFPQNGSDNVPLPERFFNGGEDTVRSFREDRLGPLDAAGAPVGGEFRNLFTAEVRFPLVNSIELALFADAGNVGRRVEAYGLSDMRYAVGPGLRWVLPIGPARFDAGYNPEKRIGEDEWVLFFSVGYPF